MNCSCVSACSAPCVLTSLHVCTAAIIAQTTIIPLRRNAVILSDFTLVSPLHFQLPLCLSSDNMHLSMIGTFPLYVSGSFLTSKIVALLILDRSSLLYASPSSPTLEDALDQAYSQYKTSGAYTAAKEQFFLPPEQYSISQFTEFVLSHRLR